MKKVCSLVLCFSLFAVGSIFAEDRPIRVYADIVGDLFHAGHIEFLKKARGFGDYLIVGVIADENVEEYKRTPAEKYDKSHQIKIFYQNFIKNQYTKV